MSRTRAAAAGLGLLGLGLALPLFAVGCAGAWTPRGRVSFAYESGGRPHPRYYCADCHGVAYFDPYYDLCLRFGYRFDWRASPEVVSAYRRDYVRIRRSDPRVGRYRYPAGARENARKRFADSEGRMPIYGESGRDTGRESGRETRGEREPTERGREHGKRGREHGKRDREKAEPGRGKKVQPEDRGDRGGNPP